MNRFKGCSSFEVDGVADAISNAAVVVGVDRLEVPRAFQHFFPRFVSVVAGVIPAVILYRFV